MRSWIASLVFCGNSSGKLGFLCLALAQLWQLLLRTGLLLGKVSCAQQPGAGLVSAGARDCWRWESCREFRHSSGCARLFGDVRSPPGLVASEAFSNLFFHYLFIIPVYEMLVSESSKTEKQSVVSSNERRAKEGVDSLCAEHLCVLVHWGELCVSLERDWDVLGRREAAQAAQCLLLLSAECLYLWSSQHSCALTRDFVRGIWPCRQRMSLLYFTKSERWYLCTGLGNDKVDAPAGKAHLCLDYLSQLKEGKVAFNSPQTGLQHGLTPSLSKKVLRMYLI